MKYTFEFYADYHQFYLQDVEYKWNETLWSDPKTIDDLIDVAPGIIGIGTASLDYVPITLEIVTVKPQDNFDGWDHVIECSLDITSGFLKFAGSAAVWPQEEGVEVTPGMYRVRTYYGGLGTLHENGFEGDDYYHVVLWPDSYIEPKVLKRYPYPYPYKENL